ncbi:probable E3 ubiquitin-protein ligase TRIML1 [Polypterus senegalus]|uniref:probable E3 ubiquitin-protein ligase TRIML1 n=1 Tax=Polypterus senegalus TaxID=55291 RepID=UPI00196501F5|nr:probable E3 ubiquitin-protein ligase TRIML1 [Polypterus senegalus]XP_039598092.1 probable E3 ubiquitin-protein ligase TRIML1 [Polypterus senegalus]
MFQRNLRSSINIGVPNLSLAPEQSSDEEKKDQLQGFQKQEEEAWETTPQQGLSGARFTCPVCKDFFTKPVTIPCGHNFCLDCITQYWDQSGLICLLCRKTFQNRPELLINRHFEEIIHSFKKAQISPSNQIYALPGDISCDACTERKFKAVKSCLTCPASFCEEHLQPHFAASALKKHTLVEPVHHLEDRICTKHTRHLELFCRNDQICVCLMCSVTNHRNHNMVHIDVEWAEKEKLLLKTHAEIQKTVADQQNKLELLRKEVESIKNAAQKEIMESGKMLDELICIIEQTRVQIIGMIERKQQSDVKQVTDKIGQLTLDIQELEKRNGDIEQLLKTEDHIRFLQKYQPLLTFPQTRDFPVSPKSTDFLLSVTQKAFFDFLNHLQVGVEKTADLVMDRMRKYAVDITLDLKTAHQKLILSSNRKEVRFGGRRLSLRDSPLQFDPVVAVLGSESFTSGKHYWEVDVGDKTDWNLGVASESINRKGNVKLNPDNGYWTIWLRNGNEFEALSSPSMALPLSLKPQKVGVFLDYDEGQLSFYNLELRCHLYTFNANFTEKLYPYFCPFIVYDGKNSAPLIISN